MSPTFATNASATAFRVWNDERMEARFAAGRHRRDQHTHALPVRVLVSEVVDWLTVASCGWLCQTLKAVQVSLARTLDFGRDRDDTVDRQGAATLGQPRQEDMLALLRHNSEGARPQHASTSVRERRKTSGGRGEATGCRARTPSSATTCGRERATGE